LQSDLMSGMVKLLLLQPSQVTSTPRRFPREDATVLEHESAHLLAMHAHGLDRSRAGANEIADCPVAPVRHPHRGEFTGAQQLGERHRIAAVRLQPVTRLPWDQRRCRDHAWIAKRGNEPIQTIAGRAGLVAKMY